jgi:glycosyltransferase involved in cell wall biosynthesis
MKKRILFVQQNIGPPGGAHLVAAHMLAALVADHDVTLLTWKPIDLAAIERYFGVTLHPAAPRVVTVPASIRAVVALDPDPQSLQPLSLLLRIGKQIGRAYDLCLTGMGEVDFGRPGIQYVHWPTYGHLYPAEVGRRLLPRLWLMLARAMSWTRPWRLISGFSFDHMRRNLTLVNSDWTGRIVQRLYGIETTTLYPPVETFSPALPWEEREEGFVYAARFHPCKRIEDAIAIVARLRAAAPHLHLHVVGTPLTSTPAERAYHGRLVALAREHATWLTLHEHLSRAELGRLVGRHRYGIHTAPREHFGLAPAEMVAAGCTVFLPYGSGQAEIVGHDPRLTFDTPDEAVLKIDRLRRDPVAGVEVRRALARRAGLFSAEHFARRLRAIVATYTPGMTSPTPLTPVGAPIPIG